MDSLNAIFDSAFPGQNPLGDGPANFIVIYGANGEPRWVIPKNPNLALPTLRQWHPFQPLAQFKWKFLLGLYQAKCLHAMPYVKPVYLKETFSLDADRIPIFYIGTPSQVRKLVITLVDPISAEPKSILKIPLTQAASENILHEASILEQINRWKPDFAPQLLSRNPENGTAFQESLKGTIAGIQFTKGHADFLSSLKQENAQVTLQESLKMLEVKLQASELSEAENTYFQAAFSALDDTVQLPGFWIHGDFSPWNVIYNRGAIKLVDWERSQPLGLPLQDLFHFLAMQRVIKGQAIHADLYKHPVVTRLIQRLHSPLSQALLKKLYGFYLLDSYLNAAKENNETVRRSQFKNFQTLWEAFG